MTPALELTDLGKRYWKLQDRAMLLRSLIPFARQDKQELWALKDVTATIQQGETVGILGRNGAGKTTLLRLLAGVSRPSEGRVVVSGRVAPLISVGVGFHHEMSGRENVYVNGMLLGLTRQQVRERLDDIIAFSELGDFIDTPVKFYSSGMFMRLGFSVAVHVDPEVLLVDEVLAVGDLGFQLKCVDRLRELQRRGSAIVLVSHSMHVIRVLCPRALLLRKGRLEFDGEAEAAVSKHHQLLTYDNEEFYTSSGSGTANSEGASLVARELRGPHGPTNQPNRDEPVTYEVRIKLQQDVESPQVSFFVVADIGIPIFSIVTTLGREWRNYKAGEEITASVSFVPRLGGGTYRLKTAVTDLHGRNVIWADDEGHLVYLPPRLGASGYADLEATVAVNGEVLSNHDDPLMTRTFDALEGF